MKEQQTREGKEEGPLDVDHLVQSEELSKRCKDTVLCVRFCWLDMNLSNLNFWPIKSEVASFWNRGEEENMTVGVNKYYLYNNNDGKAYARATCLRHTKTNIYQQDFCNCISKRTQKDTFGYHYP